MEGGGDQAVSGSDLIKRLDVIHDMAPKYNQWGLIAVTKEALEAIQEAAGEAEILLHRLAFRCCDMCGVCPREKQDPFNCEIIGTEDGP